MLSNRSLYPWNCRKPRQRVLLSHPPYGIFLIQQIPISQEERHLSSSSIAPFLVRGRVHSRVSKQLADLEELVRHRLHWNTPINTIVTIQPFFGCARIVKRRS